MSEIYKTLGYTFVFVSFVATIMVLLYNLGPLKKAANQLKKTIRNCFKKKNKVDVLDSVLPNLQGQPSAIQLPPTVPIRAMAPHPPSFINHFCQIQEVFDNAFDESQRNNQNQ